MLHDGQGSHSGAMSAQESEERSGQSSHGCLMWVPFFPRFLLKNHMFKLNPLFKFRPFCWITELHTWYPNFETLQLPHWNLNSIFQWGELSCKNKTMGESKRRCPKLRCCVTPVLSSCSTIFHIIPRCTLYSLLVCWRHEHITTSYCTECMCFREENCMFEIIARNPRW